MPEGTYNAFSRSGRVVEDPRHIVRLEDSSRWLGGDMRGVTVEEAADYLLHRVRDVTLGGLSGYYAENGRPDVIMKDGDGEHRFTWNDEEGDYEPVE